MSALQRPNLRCPACGETRFWDAGPRLMPTAWLTFFHLSWLNKRARAMVCSGCGFVSHFYEGYLPRGA